MGLRNRIIAAVAAAATLASGLGFVASADAATPAGGAGSAQVGVGPLACDQVGALGSSGMNGTSRWSLGRDGTLTIGAGTLASACSYAAVDANGDGNTNVKKIELTGPVTAGAYSTYLFANMEDVTGFDGLENLDTSHVTNMIGMFFDDKALTSLDVSHWHTGSVTNMDIMFSYDKALTSLDVSHFDTSHATDMVGMFSVDDKLTNPDVSHFDTSHATDMGSMFSDDPALASLDLSHWDTGSVTNMGGMFEGDEALASLDVSHFDTRNATDMNGMFSGDKALGSLDVSHFDTRNATDMGGMFSDDPALASLDVSHWDTGKVTDMGNMFDGAGLREVGLGSGFRFVGDNGAAAFPAAGTDGSGRYTGKWVNVGSGTENDPKGSNVWTAEQLMASYDGSRDADTYVWQPKAPVVSPGVTVKYVDEQGNRVHADQSITGDVGASYDASTPVYRLDVRGYALDGSKLPINAKGVLSDKLQTVVYTYTKDPVTSPGVTVKYADENGKSVHADQLIKGNVGDAYDASTAAYRLDVKGYALDKSKLPANAKGVLGDKPQTVVYTYRKAAAPAPAPNNNGGNANAGGSGSLATTGASIALASLGGVLLLAAGVALLWRRRRA